MGPIIWSFVPSRSSGVSSNDEIKLPDEYSLILIHYGLNFSDISVSAWPLAGISDRSSLRKPWPFRKSGIQRDLDFHFFLWGGKETDLVFIEIAFYIYKRSPAVQCTMSESNW
jgi:hypothetical protein